MKWNLRKFTQRAAAAAVAGAMALSLSMPTLAETWNLSNGAVTITRHSGYTTIHQPGETGASQAPDLTVNDDTEIELEGSYSGIGPGITVDVSEGNLSNVVLNGVTIDTTIDPAIRVLNRSSDTNHSPSLTLNLRGSNTLTGPEGIGLADNVQLCLDGGQDSGNSLYARFSNYGIHVGDDNRVFLQNNAHVTLEGKGTFIGGEGNFSAASGDLHVSDGSELTEKGIPYGITITYDNVSLDLDGQNVNDICGALSEKLNWSGYPPTITFSEQGSTYTIFVITTCDKSIAIDATTATNNGKTVNVQFGPNTTFHALGDLTVNGANDVTVKGSVSGDATINCSGDVSITAGNGCAVGGTLKVCEDKTLTAGNVTIKNSYADGFALSNGATINCSGDVEISNSVGGAVDGDLTINQTGTESKVILSSSSGTSPVNGTLTYTTTQSGYYVLKEGYSENDTSKLHQIFQNSLTKNFPYDPYDSDPYSCIKITPLLDYGITVTYGDWTTEVNSVNEDCILRNDEDGQKLLRLVEENGAYTLTSRFDDQGTPSFTKPLTIDATKAKKAVDVDLTSVGKPLSITGARNVKVFSTPGNLSSVDIDCTGAVSLESMASPMVDGTLNIIHATDMEIQNVNGGTALKGNASINCSGTVKIWGSPLHGGVDVVGGTLTYTQAEHKKYTVKLDDNKSEPQGGKYTASSSGALKGVSKLEITPTDTEDDTPIADDTTGTSGGGEIGGAIAAVAVGGAAVWGGYEVATRVILNHLLPEGAAIPKTRGALALLVWQTAGCPEPANAPAFADVTDEQLAKAAQWCIEQGYMEARADGSFKPEGRTTKARVIQVWNKAFPKQ